MYVSFVHDVPDVPPDVIHIYSAFIELRHSTSADLPVSFQDKILAWKIFDCDARSNDDDDNDVTGNVAELDYETFARFVNALDSTFSEHMQQKRERDRESRKKNREVKKSSTLESKEKRDPPKIIGRK